MSRIRYNLAVNKTTAYTRSAVSLRIDLLLRAEVNFQKEVQKEIYKWNRFSAASDVQMNDTI